MRKLGFSPPPMLGVANPHRNYGPKVYTDKNLGKSYGLRALPNGKRIERTQSGRARRVTVMHYQPKGVKYPYSSERQHKRWARQRGVL